MLTPATALGGALSERLRLAENGEFMTLNADPPTDWSQVLLGLGLIVVLCYRSSTLYHIRCLIRYLYF